MSLHQLRPEPQPGSGTHHGGPAAESGLQVQLAAAVKRRIPPGSGIPGGRVTRAASREAEASARIHYR